MLAGEELCGSASLLTLSVLTPFAAFISHGGGGKNPALLNYDLLTSVSFAELLTPLEKTRSQ